MQDNVTIKPINPSVKKWILVSALLGYVALLFFLFFFVDTSRLFSVLGSISLGVYALAIVSILISLLFHSLVWF